ncbi:hypothetical protein [Plantibacter sp. VKM Ac-2885]|uniref:MmyB family transcriptional regulator n=1 Tax=Plantibacter sp. VKM Ac-2885 TaxID=2783828 RepID=UPI00351CB19D
MIANEGVRERRDRIRDFIDSWREVPVVLCDRTLDVLEANPAAARLTPAFHTGVNLARFAFLSPDRVVGDPLWTRMSETTAELLKRSIEEHDADRPAARIIGELSAKSRDFAQTWASGDGHSGTSGPIVFPTPAGEVRMVYNVLNAPGPEGDLLLVFVPTGASSRARLKRLSEAVSPDEPSTSSDPVPSR